MALKDFNMNTFKRYTNPQAIKDLDKFLDKLPGVVGVNTLILVAITWVLAGGAILFASIESGEAAELRAKLVEVESLRPPVPTISLVPLEKTSLEAYIDKIERIDLYPVLNFSATNGSLTISGSDSAFTAMTYAIGHIQGGGRNWHVDLDTMCIGAECTGGTMNVKLKMSTVRINESAPALDKG